MIDRSPSIHKVEETCHSSQAGREEVRWEPPSGHFSLRKTLFKTMFSLSHQEFLVEAHLHWPISKQSASVKEGEDQGKKILVGTFSFPNYIAAIEKQLMFLDQ